MKTTKHALPALVLAVMVMGSVACSPSTDTPSTEASGVETSAAESGSSATAAPTMAPTMGPSAGSSPGTSESADAAPAEEAMITIADFEYEIPESIAPGAEVTLVNDDDAPHTVTAESEGGFDVEVGPGETVTFTAPEEPGEYQVICTYHPEMSGTLVIG